MAVRRRVTFNSIFILTIVSYVNGESIINGVVKDVVKSLNTDTSDSDVFLNVTQLIKKYGYCEEEYVVETEDGYILKLIRINKIGQVFPAKVILCMHGLLNSADDFVVLKNHSLSFLLADAGYDVWLGNVRGNKYSRAHKSLSPNERPFWNFTFHEMGKYDLPAIIDTILEKTNQPDLTYIGHSQGTTMFYVMASIRPEYNSKISLKVSLAPIAWLSHAKTFVFTFLVPMRYQEYILAQVLGLYEILPYDAFWRFITTRVCPSSNFALFICASIVFALYGYDYEQVDYKQFPSQIGHLPAGASTKQLLHYAQLSASGNFQCFDYKLKNLNIEAYNSETPPQYNLEKITVPIILFVADNDWISSMTDVKNLRSKLSNVLEVYKVPFPKFNHMDYLWAKDAKKLVYVKILELIKKYKSVPRK